MVLGAGILGTPMHASAWEYRCRFIERVGSADIPIENNTIFAANGEPRRIRIQFGVFDDENGPAPMGGHAGWNLGTISVSGPAGNSDERRTPGRLAPFTFASLGGLANGNPPLPHGDPFTFLDRIDATLGIQSPFWGCNPDGTPAPMPGPVLRGYNAFASNYDITIDPNPGATSYTITFAGNLVGVAEWRMVGLASPPDCGNPSDPDDDVPGVVTYAPFPTDPLPFESVLNVVVPAPGAFGVVSIIGLLATTRARR